MVGQAPPYQNRNPEYANKANPNITYINRLQGSKKIAKNNEKGTKP